MRTAAILIFAASLLLTGVTPARGQDFRRGDCNDDGVHDLVDALFLLDGLFTGGSQPTCDDACDCDDSGDLNLIDVVLLLTAMFGNATLPAPYPDCGEDPTADSLDCQTVQCVPPTLYRVNCGGPNYNDTEGNFWESDNYSTSSGTFVSSHSISGTSDDTLYQSERYGSFTYSFPVVAGDYEVILYFAEIFWGAPGGGSGGPGQRLFNVAIEGVQVLSSYDIWADVGAVTATQKSFPTSVSDGFLTIVFSSVVDNPKCSAIEIRGYNGVPPPPPVPPVAEFIGASTSGMPPLVVNFTDQSTENPTSWLWNFGDGGMSTDQHPSHTYMSAGTYTVTMTATNTDGSDTRTRTNYIDVSNTTPPPILPLNMWQRHTIDNFLSHRTAFVMAADLNGDGHKDICTGGWWYQNPGSASGNWIEHTIGGQLHNMSYLYDFDNDGDVDILGTDGQYEGIDMFWARNNGSGVFTVLSNVDNGVSTFGEQFTSGVVLDVFQAGVGEQVAFSWNGGETGSSQMQMLTIPANPSTQQWTLSTFHPSSLGEGLSGGDIDDDGDIDLFQGTQWLRNEGNGTWTKFDIASFGPEVDRNRLADFDGDGDLDAALGFLNGSTNIVWLEAPANPTQNWTTHTVNTNVAGGLSLDVADMDNDGDVDIIHGELWGPSRCFIYENVNNGASWVTHMIDNGNGMEHHDGTRVVDIDNDGDLDIMTIGWFTLKVWLLENLAIP